MGTRGTNGKDAETLSQLISLSQRYGGDDSFVIAGGGNTSVKCGEIIYVKASGRELAGVTERDLVGMKRADLAGLLEQDLGDDPLRREKAFKKAVMAARAVRRNLRPSVECALHNAMPHRFVVHTHPTLVNMAACAAGGEEVLHELFGDDILVLPYVDPGFTLSKALAAAVAERTSGGAEAPSVVFLLNHGLIVGGETPDEVVRRTDAVIEKLAARFTGVPMEGAFGEMHPVNPEAARGCVMTIAPALRALLSQDGRFKVVVFDDSPAAMAIAAGAQGRSTAEGGPLTPDQVVYCRCFPMWFEVRPGAATQEVVARLREEVAAYVEANGHPPKIVIAGGLGIFAADTQWRGADIARRIYIDAIKVMAGARTAGGVRYLDRREREFIDNWEVEKYRREVASPDRGGRMGGKTAVVTGAAQGFGLEIARDLAREGAHVAMSDINFEGVTETAREVEGQSDAGRAKPYAVDVADAASVAECVWRVVCDYGGFDVFISNAGILRAGSVKTQPADEFEAVTAVNYRGYFHCVKHAAPVMAVQHAAAPGVWADIIQINSKSGLRGSNRNAAYAGGKFGGIGLTQSFALELIEDGIKVNAVCPGNFYDGPLWSDPDKGLFVQYLKSGKVPGAKTIEDVRRAYNAKVPMGRGCTAADLMKAIYYIIEQQYETGQAVPVTGGQVMLP